CYTECPCDCSSNSSNADGCCECKNQTSGSPLSLPSLGRPVKIHMSGNGSTMESDAWGQVIGFGQFIRLNLASKLLLTADGRFARVMLPDYETIVSFGQQQGNAWSYAPVQDQSFISPNAVLQFSNVNNGVPG